MATRKYNKGKKQMDHEREIALINMMARDPEMKYFIGMAAGAGVAWVGALMGAADPEEDSSSASSEFTEAAKKLAYGYLAVQTGGLTGLGLLAALNFTDGYGAGGLAGQMGNILALGGVSFAGTCAMILILRSIFSGTDLGELLSGVGEIIPL